MPRLALAAVLLLPACATEQPPVQGQASGRECQAGGTDQLIGQVGTSETGATVLRASHAAVLRWAPPGAMLTMDYREDRVTVWLDPAGKITQIKCG